VAAMIACAALGIFLLTGMAPNWRDDFAIVLASLAGSIEVAAQFIDTDVAESIAVLAVLIWMPVFAVLRLQLGAPFKRASSLGRLFTLLSLLIIVLGVSHRILRFKTGALVLEMAFLLWGWLLAILLVSSFHRSRRHAGDRKGRTSIKEKV
jgi:hypothetical protein